MTPEEIISPDKIYMPNELLTEEWQRHIENEDTAYIRKDALLEWAESELESITGNFELAEGGRIALGLLINKLNLM